MIAKTSVRPHLFVADPAIPPDHNGRRGCTCGLMGHPGDPHHTVDNPAAEDGQRRAAHDTEEG